MGEVRVIHLAGKAAQRSFLGCRSDDIVILSTAAERVFNCETYDPKRLRETGSLGVTRGAVGWDIITANAVAGQRPWSRHSPEIPARHPFWARADLR
jgi:competence protein ComEC